MKQENNFNSTVPTLFYSTRQIGEMFKVSRWTVYKWQKEGTLKATKVRTANKANSKYARSFYTANAIRNLVDYRFPSLTSYEKRLLHLRLMKGK